MPIPDLVGGLLPRSRDGEPYSAYSEEIESRFATTAERRRAWAGFLSLRDLIDWLLSDVDPEGVSPIKWWLRGRFLSTAADVSEVEATALLPRSDRWPTDPRRALLIRLLVQGNVARATLWTSVRSVTLDEDDDEMLRIERRRCARNHLLEGDEFVDSGWIEVL